MRNSVLILFLTIVFNCNAQRIRPFVGSIVFLDKDFKNSLFVGFNGGVEFNMVSFFKPELEISCFLGAIEDVEIQDNTGNISEIFLRNAYALNFSVTPKIDLGSSSTNSEVAMVHFQILPKYTISKNEGRGNYTIINQNNPSKSLVEREVVTEWQHSIGIGIGLHFPVSHKNHNSISLNLYYNGIDLGDALNKLNHRGNYEFNTKNVMGLGMNYFFGLKKKIQTG